MVVYPFWQNSESPSAYLYVDRVGPAFGHTSEAAFEPDSWWASQRVFSTSGCFWSPPWSVRYSFFPFIFAKIQSFIDSSKFFYTFLAYSPFVFTKNRTNRKLMGALMANIGQGAHALSTPTQRKKLSNKVWIPQFSKWLKAKPPARFLFGFTLKVK